MLAKGYIGPYQVEKAPGKNNKDNRYRVIRHDAIGAAKLEAILKAKADAVAAKQAEERNTSRSVKMTAHAADEAEMALKPDLDYMHTVDSAVTSVRGTLEGADVIVPNAFRGLITRRSTIGRDEAMLVPSEGANAVYKIHDVEITSDKNGLILQSFTIEDQYNNIVTVNAESSKVSQLVADALKGNDEYAIRKALAAIRVTPKVAQLLRNHAGVWSQFNITGRTIRDANIKKVHDNLNNISDTLDKFSREIAGKQNEVEQQLHALAIRHVAEHNERLQKAQSEEEDTKYNRAEKLRGETAEAIDKKHTSNRGSIIINPLARDMNTETIKMGTTMGLKAALVAPLVGVDSFSASTPTGTRRFRFRQRGDSIRIEEFVGTRADSTTRNINSEEDTTSTYESELWKDITPQQPADSVSSQSDLRGIMALVAGFFAYGASSNPSAKKLGFSNLKVEGDLDELFEQLPPDFAERWMDAFMSMREGTLKDVMVAEMTKSGVSAATTKIAAAAVDEASETVDSTVNSDAFQRKIIGQVMNEVTSPEEMGDLLREANDLAAQTSAAGVTPLEFLNEPARAHIERFADYVDLAAKLGDDVVAEQAKGELPDDVVNAAMSEYEEEQNELYATGVYKRAHSDLMREWAKLKVEVEELKKSVAEQREAEAKKFKAIVERPEKMHFGDTLRTQKFSDATYKDEKGDEKLSTAGRFYAFVDKAAKTEQDKFDSAINRLMFAQHEPAGEPGEGSWFKAHLNGVRNKLTARWNSLMEKIKAVNMKVSNGFATGLKLAATSVVGEFFTNGFQRIATEVLSAKADILLAVKNPKWVLAIGGAALAVATKSAVAHFAGKFTEAFTDRLFSSNSTLLRSVASAVSKVLTAWMIKRAFGAAADAATTPAEPAEQEAPISSQVAGAAKEETTSFLNEFIAGLPVMRNIFETLSGNEDKADLIANAMRANPDMVAADAHDVGKLRDMFDREFSVEAANGQPIAQVVHDGAVWNLNVIPESCSRIRFSFTISGTAGRSPLMEYAGKDGVTAKTIIKYMTKGKNAPIVPATLVRKDGKGNLGMSFLRALESSEAVIHPGASSFSVVLKLRKVPKEKSLFAGFGSVREMDERLEGTLLEAGTAQKLRAAVGKA